MKPASFCSGRLSRPCHRRPPCCLSTAARASLALNTNQPTRPSHHQLSLPRDLKCTSFTSLCAGRSRPRSRGARLKACQGERACGGGWGSADQGGSEAPEALEGTERARAGSREKQGSGSAKHSWRHSQCLKTTQRTYNFGHGAARRQVGLYTHTRCCNRIRWWPRCKKGFDVILRVSMFVF